MKLLKILCLLSIFASCSVSEDDSIDLDIEQIFSDNLDITVKVDVVFVQSSNRTSQSTYDLDVPHFINHLNGSFFHRYGIGLEKGDVITLINDELYDLRDNRGEESRVFLRETQNHNKNRVTIYVIKRSNTVGLAGIGKDQRALITDEFLYATTAPHEIGHALGLLHYSEEGNLMSEVRPYLRREFVNEQIAIMKSCVSNLVNHE